MGAARMGVVRWNWGAHQISCPSPEGLLDAGRRSCAGQGVTLWSSRSPKNGYPKTKNKSARVRFRYVFEGCPVIRSEVTNHRKNRREGCGILTLYPWLVVAAFSAERDLRTHHASRSTAVPEQSREQGINAPTLSGFGVLQAFGHRRSDRAVYGNTHPFWALTWVVAILSELA